MLWQYCTGLHADSLATFRPLVALCNTLSHTSCEPSSGSPGTLGAVLSYIFSTRLVLATTGWLDVTSRAAACLLLHGQQILCNLMLQLASVPVSCAPPQCLPSSDGISAPRRPLGRGLIASQITCKISSHPVVCVPCVLVLLPSAFFRMAAPEAWPLGFFVTSQIKQDPSYPVLCRALVHLPPVLLFLMGCA
jgi:hypothetical protein